ncbi:MAG: HNH endonuclease [Polyangiaceae bacterium]|nr:HNH endonuclease [Polyangiaceae bacterium]
MISAGFATSRRGDHEAQRRPRHLHSVDRLEGVERLDVALARLARGGGRLRLALGEGLDALGRVGGHHALGFSSLAAYARERAGRSTRWTVETRTLARRLRSLPALRAALASGALGWCMAELIARHATAETEAGLVDLGLRSTVRQMRVHLARPGDDQQGNDDDPTCTLTLTLSPSDAWLFAWTRRFADHVGGRHDAEGVMSALLGEGMSTLCCSLPANDVEACASAGAAGDQERACRAELARCQLEAEARSEANFGARGPGGGGVALPRASGVTVPELDARITALAADLASHEVELARVALAFHQAGGARLLGYTTEAQYARERLGMSASSYRAKLTLARRWLGRVQRALEQREIGHEAAQLIARVATADSAAAWVARARVRTVKHLAEDVRAAELLRDVGGSAWPPTPEKVRSLHALEGRLLAGEREAVLAARRQMSAQATPVRVRLRVSQDTARFYRALESATQKHLPRGVSFTALLCELFWDAWKHLATRDHAYARIYARDRYTCTSPVCSRHDVTPHHVRFRSRGGGDEADNVTSLCTWCHLEGVHGGRIRVSGRVGQLHWEVGGACVDDGSRYAARTCA